MTFCYQKINQYHYAPELLEDGIIYYWSPVVLFGQSGNVLAKVRKGQYSRSRITSEMSCSGHTWLTAALAQRVWAFGSHAEGWVFEASRDRPKSLKQVVTNTIAKRSGTGVSRVLGDDIYKRIPRVTAGVAS